MSLVWAITHSGNGGKFACNLVFCYGRCTATSLRTIHSVEEHSYQWRPGDNPHYTVQCSGTGVTTWRGKPDPVTYNTYKPTWWWRHLVTSRVVLLTGTSHSHFTHGDDGQFYLPTDATSAQHPHHQPKRENCPHSATTIRPWNYGDIILLLSCSYWWW